MSDSVFSGLCNHGWLWNGPCVWCENDRLHTKLDIAKENLTGWENMRESYYHLEGLLAERDKRIEELEAAYKAVTKTIHLPPGCGKYIITEEQIDKAWDLLDDEGIDSLSVAAALAGFGIVACDECGGCGFVCVNDAGDTEDCPECNGHGWVWKEVSDE